MIQILCNQKAGLRVCHLNAQSLINKLDEFRYIFEHSDVDVVCISETWYRAEFTDEFLGLSGYTLFRKDRAIRTNNSRETGSSDGFRSGGGVAMYVKQCHKSKLITTSEDSDKTEFLLVEIKHNQENILLGTVYRRHQRTDYESFLTKVSDFALPYTDIIIAGDFNSNLLRESALINNMESLGLFPVNTTVPTHHTHNSSTLIDSIFISNKNKSLLYDQLSAPSFSKHDLLFLTYTFSVITTPPVIEFRDFRNINLQSLTSDCLSVSWSQIYLMPTVNEQVEFLNEQILQLFERHVPLRTKIIRQNDHPWFTPRIKLLMLERDKAYHRWKNFKVPSDHEKYKQLRNEVTKLVRTCKKNHYVNKFISSRNSKSTWNLIRDVSLGQKQHHVIHDNLDDLNKKFTSYTSDNSVPEPLQPICDTPISSLIQNIDFSFACVNQCDVLNSIMSVKSNAVGLDGMHPKFIKIILPIVLPYITHIFNTCLTTSQFPDLWKVSKIIPIPKSKTEYRPIAILAFLSKALENIMYRQMNEYFTKYKLLSERQSGFREKRGCISAVLDVSEYLRENADKGKVCFLLMLDHSKAFDNVNHNILIFKLTNYYNFSGTAARLVASYLNGRSQFVCSGNSMSSSLPLDRGVPQGSVLGPFLFSIYVNELPTIISNAQTHLYADDVQIYAACDPNDINDCIETLNENMDKVSEWAEQNKLSINPNKSQCLVIHKKNINTENLPKIFINQASIDYVTTAKNLGIVFNKTLSWNDHIRLVVGKVYGLLRLLWTTQMYLPTHIRALIAKTRLMPLLLYGCELYANCDSSHKLKLRVIYNNIVRFVYGLRRSDDLTPFRNKLYGYSFDYLLKFRVLIFLQKVIHTKEPNYLYSRLRFSRSERNQNIIPVRHTTLLSERQFYLYAIRLWNALPASIQSVGHADRFKSKLHNFFCNPTNNIG